MRFGIADGRDENDRRMFRAFALANEEGGFESVHSRHVDIEQNDGEIPL